jgi:hypothetical protein
MKYLICGVLLLVVGCSSTPKLTNYDGPKAMDRADVVKAHKDCVNARMRPFVDYVVVNTEHGKLLVPVDVKCEPVR